MSELGEANTPFLDDEQIQALESFRRAGVRRLHEPSFLERVDPPAALGAASDARVFAASDVNVGVERVLQSKGYRVAERRICVARLEWSAAFELGVFEKASYGRTQRLLPVVCGSSGWSG
jgi:hypothetical protein